MNEAKVSPQPPKKKMKWWWQTLIWIGGVFILLIVVGIIAGAGKPSNTSTKNTNANNQQVYAINQDVRVGDVRWKLLNAKNRGNTLKASESRYATIAKDKTTPGKFVEITMEVENLGSDMKTVTNLTLVDSKGREYTSSTDTSEWVPEGKELVLLTNLNPNVPQQFVDIYEVPVDATTLQAKVGDLDLFKNKAAVISLGI